MNVDNKPKHIEISKETITNIENLFKEIVEHLKYRNHYTDGKDFLLSWDYKDSVNDIRLNLKVIEKPNDESE